MQDTRAIHIVNRTKSGEPILLFEIPGGSETTVDEREVVLFGRESNVKLFKRILTAAKRSRVLFEERKEYKYNTPDYIKLGTVLEQATEFTVAAHNLVENGSSVDDAITKIAEEDRNNLRLAGFTSDEVESSVKNSVRFAQALLAPSRV